MFWNTSNKVTRYEHNLAMAFFASITTAAIMYALDFINETHSYSEPIFHIVVLIVLLILMLIFGQILSRTYDKFD